MALQIHTVEYPEPKFDMTYRNESDIIYAIVHHTAGALRQTALDIDAEHRAIGDAMIAYNMVITPDGQVYDGRPEQYDSAAAFGANGTSVDVVCVGNFQSDDAGYTGPPTDAQLNALLQVLTYWHRKYPRIQRTLGHQQVASVLYPTNPAPYATACPGDKMMAVLPGIIDKVRAAVNVH